VPYSGGYYPSKVVACPSILILGGVFAHVNTDEAIMRVISSLCVNCDIRLIRKERNF